MNSVTRRQPERDPSGSGDNEAQGHGERAILSCSADPLPPEPSPVVAADAAFRGDRMVDDGVGLEPDAPSSAPDLLDRGRLLAGQEAPAGTAEFLPEPTDIGQRGPAKAHVRPEGKLEARARLARDRADARHPGELEQPLREPARPRRFEMWGASPARTTHARVIECGGNPARPVGPNGRVVVHEGNQLPGRLPDAAVPSTR